MSEPLKMVCGVGLTFNQEGSNGRITVACVSKGGSAEQQGKIQVGDVIEYVDATSVVGKSLAEVKNLMRGELGTYVNLKLRRGEHASSGIQYEASLMRGQAEAFLLREKQRLQALLENDRKQLDFAQVIVQFTFAPCKSCFGMLTVDFVWQVENEALYKTLHRIQTQSQQDQKEMERLSGELHNSNVRIIELQEMASVVKNEREQLLAEGGEDGGEV